MVQTASLQITSANQHWDLGVHGVCNQSNVLAFATQLTNTVVG